MTRPLRRGTLFHGVWIGPEPSGGLWLRNRHDEDWRARIAEKAEPFTLEPL